jgi:periplasmic nitrate reductase NapD
MSETLHIASFVIQHRPEAAAALDAAIEHLPCIELMLRQGSRSVVLCEAENEHLLMEQVDVLRGIEGVMGVSLVHHHAEATASLMEEMDHDHAP